VTQPRRSIAFSPCPNDTFVFHALVHGLVPGAPDLAVTYADVDVTNTAAERGAYDLVKVSYAALPWLLSDEAEAGGGYELLPCGGALGRGCGPLVLTRDGGASSGAAGSGSGSNGGASLAGRSIAIPGERTTAYLLMRLWSAQSPPARVEVVPFAEIMPAVAAGRFDAGLVIHEARFTYPKYGLRALVDLGEWWESDTGLPIPLGAILARRDTVDPVAAADWIRTSVRMAWADPSASEPYVLAHAQEMAPDVVRRHIDLYVNEYTEDLGERGYAAIRALLSRAAEQGLTPAVKI
jgi:1,4-dihydroxy-6-naphthoate synthase